MERGETVDCGRAHHERSIRSRASSVISTGTKTSIGTFAHEEQHGAGIDVLLGTRNFRITARPGSIISISSFDCPAPAYEAHTSNHASNPQAPAPTPILRTNSVPLRAQAPNPSSSQTTLPTPKAMSPPTPQSPSREPSPPSPPVSPSLIDPENALSQHYTRVVRTIDANHHAEIARLKSTHATELAQIRHDIDQAYRKELKAKDVQIEHIREETSKAIAETEERCMHELELRSRELDLARNALIEQEARLSVEWAERVDKARNAVEDQWELRWQDRARITQLGAEIERERQQIQLAQALEVRDKQWTEYLAREEPELARVVTSPMSKAAVENEVRLTSETKDEYVAPASTWRPFSRRGCEKKLSGP